MFKMTSPNKCPAKNMMGCWLSFMIPVAWLTWKHTASIAASVAAFLAAPAFAILQGTIGILRYRVLYGDAPLPLSPAHGVVVVNPDSSDTIAASCVNEEHITGCCCLGGRRWRNTTNVSESERQLLAKALKEQPLRLLVIGDSLAIGVGTSRSCTPLMPEVIARTLSKALGGRAVYWTCHGEPGASAGWIVRELECGVGNSSSSEAEEVPPTCGDVSTDTSVASEDDTVSASFSEEEELDTLPTEWQEWRDRLHRHRKRFDPDVLGPYDVAVVFSGSNDLKSAFFPFLLTGEDVHFRKQAKERGGSYANELQLVLEVLRHRMKEGIDEIRDNILEHLHPISPRTRTHKQSQTRSGDDKNHPASPHNSHNSANGPLIVLPGLAARALPIFRRLPLRWLAVPIVDKLDNHKRELAMSHPDEVIFVNPPTVAGITEYEEQRGPIWEQRESEDTLLALRDVHRRTCRRIETDMHEYYAEEDSFEILKRPPSFMPQHNAPVPPLSQRPGRPGSKIFSRDQVHPNDEGYDYWGRYIGSAVVQQWKKNH